MVVKFTSSTPPNTWPQYIDTGIGHEGQNLPKMVEMGGYYQARTRGGGGGFEGVRTNPPFLASIRYKLYPALQLTCFFIVQLKLAIMTLYK